MPYQLKRTVREDIILSVKTYQRFKDHKKEELEEEQILVYNLLLLGLT